LRGYKEATPPYSYFTLTLVLSRRGRGKNNMQNLPGRVRERKKELMERKNIKFLLKSFSLLSFPQSVIGNPDVLKYLWIPA